MINSSFTIQADILPKLYTMFQPNDKKTNRFHKGVYLIWTI